MRRTDPLNDRQLAVLQWVADGHPADAMQGNMYKRTAAALQDRRLVKISRAGGNWSAVLTEAGQHYLAHGSFPADVGSTAGRVADARPSPRQQASAAVRSSQSSPSRSRSSTEQLVANVLAAGGVLEEAELDRVTRNRLSELVKQVNRFGKAPAGKRLVRRSIPEPGGGYYARRWQVVLEDGPAGTDAPLVPVAVPAEVRRYHPAVAALRKGDDLRIRGEARARALRVASQVRCK